MLEETKRNRKRMTGKRRANEGGCCLGGMDVSDLETGRVINLIQVQREVLVLLPLCSKPFLAPPGYHSSPACHPSGGSTTAPYATLPTIDASVVPRGSRAQCIQVQPVSSKSPQLRHDSSIPIRSASTSVGQENDRYRQPAVPK